MSTCQTSTHRSSERGDEWDRWVDTDDWTHPHGPYDFVRGLLIDPPLIARSYRARAHARASAMLWRAAVNPAVEQLPLPGFGPAVGDPFRFTWWNTRQGAAVWIEHHGRWRTDVVVGLGRKRAAVAIETAAFRRLVIEKFYNQLRRWR